MGAFDAEKEGSKLLEKGKIIAKWQKEENKRKKIKHYKKSDRKGFNKERAKEQND